jgi:hypothetical protein
MSSSKKVTWKGTLRQLFICLRPPPCIHLCNKYMVVMYNHVFINIILAMPYKYNLSDAFINVFLESFSERKISC